jgi:uncharacterized protein
MSQFEIREVEPGGPIELRGHAATFGRPYRVGSFVEEIRPGAFRRSLAENPDVSLLINHAGLPLARTTSGTMELGEDDTGLLVRAQLEPSDPDVRSVVPKMRRGDLGQMSFGFKATQQDWSKDKSKRALREVQLHRGDVSIVTRPANESATATIRSDTYTFEQRQRVAERVGERVCGPGSYTFADSPGSSLRIARRPAVEIAPSDVEVERARRAKAIARADGRRPTTSAAGAIERAKRARALARATSRRP